MSDIRVGTGYDSHRLEVGIPLVLGGVTVPFDKGLEGHSDGDALAHAVADALLGAAALGDIGKYFPDSDEQWRGANSLGILARCVVILKEAGWQPLNVDATVVAQEPKLAGHTDHMRLKIAQTLEVDVGAVSVKATTDEGMGPIGRGEGIAAHAVALVSRGV